MYFYAAEEDWGRVARALLRSAERGDAVGLDTEFYGVGEGYPPFDVRKESCAGGRTRVHMWSVAIKRWPHELSPRGFHLADAAVLLSPALDAPELRRWLESDTVKVVHNLSVDAHSLANHGIALGGAVNSLATARWVYPGRARGRGFSLDSLGIDLLGLGKTASYSDVFSESVEEIVRMRETRTRTCSCGVTGCRKRKGHAKTDVITQEPVRRMVVRDIPLHEVVPGHRKWTEAVPYSARDAVLALGVHDLIQREMQRGVPVPWML